MKQEFYDMKRLEEKNALWNVIFGMRSNGKSFQVQKKILKTYCETGKQGAYIRRFDTDIKGQLGFDIWKNFLENEIEGNIIEKLTRGKFNSYIYQSRRWILVHRDDNNEIDLTDVNPFCYALAINQEEHLKGGHYEGVTTILFDEFLSRSFYLPNEFVSFNGICSTIIRLRNNVKIYLCGNTISQYCPYFAEMGLKNIKKQKKGTIDIYTYSNKALTVAVEYTDAPTRSRKSDVYFAFDNPKLKMITSGEWEIGLYPHLPYKYKPNEILYNYFIVFDGEIRECEVIFSREKQETFTYIHRKTTPIKEDEKHLIYKDTFTTKTNYRRRITKPQTEFEKKLLLYYTRERVFYQDNETGELIRNYLMWCNQKEM